METEIQEFRVKDSIAGNRVGTTALLAVAPGLVIAGVFVLRVVQGALSPVWLVGSFVIVTMSIGLALAKARAGDRIVLKQRHLHIYRGNKLREMTSVNRITSIQAVGPKILIRRQDGYIELHQPNYEPETWERMKAALQAFHADKSPVMDAIRSRGTDASSPSPSPPPPLPSSESGSGPHGDA